MNDFRVLTVENGTTRNRKCYIMIFFIWTMSEDTFVVIFFLSIILILLQNSRFLLKDCMSRSFIISSAPISPISKGENGLCRILFFNTKFLLKFA